MVTAELAVALPAVALLLAIVLGAFDLAIAQLRCVDAARTAARSAARGDPPGRVAELAARSGPPGAWVSLRRSDGLVTVTVTGPPARLIRLLPLAARPSATSVALDERLLGGPGPAG